MPTAAALKLSPAIPFPLATVDIKTLLEEHDRIDLLSEEVALLSTAANPDVARTTETLATLASVVTEHLRAEDISIYPMIATLMPNPHLREAHEVAANFEGLRADWIDFLGEWTPDCVEADWPGFGEAAHAMLARLRARVHWETSLLYPYALRLGIIRLRPAPANA